MHVYTQAKYDEDVAAFHALHPIAPVIYYKDHEYYDELVFRFKINAAPNPAPKAFILVKNYDDGV